MPKTQDVTLSSLDLTKFLRELRDTHKWDVVILEVFDRVHVHTSNLNHFNEIKAMAFLMGLVEYEINADPTEWGIGLRKPN